MDSPATAATKRQTRFIVVVFVSLFAVLALLYYAVLRTDYVVLYDGLKPADASVVVTELDAKTVPYKLRDDGTTVLVAADRVDQVRLGLVGSDASSKGLIGFELFNKSDMGLTDFAQKINYQRALQGELARTIMTMEGIEAARVHLAIPERSLFRGVRSEPKAAVTLTTGPGQAIDSMRVAGIQRLVAAAVADLPLANVAVLDDVGRVISQSAELDPIVAPEMEERAAVQQYYRARIRSAVDNVMPGLRFEVRVQILSTTGEPEMGSWDVPASEVVADGVAAEIPARGGDKRDFNLRIRIITASSINPEDQKLVANAVSDAVALNAAAGDTMSFGIEPVGTRMAAAPPIAIEPLPVGIVTDPAAAAKRLAGSNGWLAAVAALVGLCALLIAARWRSPRLSDEQRTAFVERIRRQLSSQETDDARA